METVGYQTLKYFTKSLTSEKNVVDKTLHALRCRWLSKKAMAV